MKIAVDFQSAQGKRTGIGVFAVNLFSAIQKETSAHEFIFYKKNTDRDLNVPGRIAWESLEIPRKISKDKPKIIYSPGFSPPYACAARRVVTVHDLIGLAYPQNQTSFSYFYWSQWLPAALKRAHRLIASSESTRKDIARFLKIHEGKVGLVPLACDERYKKIEEKNKLDEICLKYNLSLPFMISVGTLEPRKNFMGLIRAYHELHKRRDAHFSLLIIGKAGAVETEIVSYIRENSLGGVVKVLGYVPDEDLAGLYNAAIGYANLSFYEGFGLPALEAMSCGLSGVVSRRSSLPEVVGETGILVDPGNIDEIADALKNFVSDGCLRRDLSEKAHERSKLFSMKRTAREMLAIFDEEAGV